MVPDPGVPPNRLQRMRARARGGVGLAPPRGTTAPRVSLEVVEWLEECYPDVAPEPTDPPETMLRKAIEVSVVRMVRSVYEGQHQSGLSVAARLAEHVPEEHD